MRPEEDLHARPAAQFVKGEREDAREAVDALAHLGGGVG